MAESSVRRLVHAQARGIEWQAVGDIFGLCGRVARHRLQAQIQHAAIDRGGQVADYQAAVALDQRLDREAFDRVPGGGAQLDLQRPCQPVVDPGLPLRTDRLQAQLGHGGGALGTACASGRGGSGSQSPALAPVAGVCGRARQQRQQQAGQGQARHRRFQRNGPPGLYPILNRATGTAFA